MRDIAAEFGLYLQNWRSVMRAYVVRRPHRVLAIVAALAVGLALVSHERTVTATSGMTTVMSGLENPRGLAVGAPYPSPARLNPSR